MGKDGGEGATTWSLLLLRPFPSDDDGSFKEEPFWGASNLIENMSTRHLFKKHILDENG